MTIYLYNQTYVYCDVPLFSKKGCEYIYIYYICQNNYEKIITSDAPLLFSKGSCAFRNIFVEND